MGRSRESLLDAASAYAFGREDRLTEVFATVLAACDELTAALFAEVDLPVGDRFQVFTQVVMTKGDRPDMVIHSLDRSGAEVSRIISEHKVDSGFGNMQRERYLKALRALPVAGELIFIVAFAPTAREGGDWRGFTWQEIAELAEGVGRTWGGREWRQQALAPTTSAKWRLLWELLWYIEEEMGLAVTQPLNEDNVLTYKLMDDTAQAVAALVERAAQNAAPLRPSGELGDDGPTLWQHFEVPSTSSRKYGQAAVARRPSAWRRRVRSSSLALVKVHSKGLALCW